MPLQQGVLRGRRAKESRFREEIHSFFFAENMRIRSQED